MDKHNTKARKDRQFWAEVMFLGERNLSDGGVSPYIKSSGWVEAPRS